MSYMRGDLLTKTRKLVKGLAKPTPKWLKAMEQAPPVVFPRTDGKIKVIELPEDVYVKKFFKKHPDSLYHDAVKISGFNPPPARVFAWRVLELKEQGVSEEEAMALADMEYRQEKKDNKKAYKELKRISPLLGKKPPPNPYPSAIKEIQAEEKKYVHERIFNHKILEIVQKMKAEKGAELQERQNSRGFSGENQQSDSLLPGRPGEGQQAGWFQGRFGGQQGGQFQGRFGGQQGGQFQGRFGGQQGGQFQGRFGGGGGGQGW